MIPPIFAHRENFSHIGLGLQRRQLYHATLIVCSHNYS